MQTIILDPIDRFIKVVRSEVSEIGQEKFFGSFCRHENYEQNLRISIRKFEMIMFHN